MPPSVPVHEIAPRSPASLPQHSADVKSSQFLPTKTGPGKLPLILAGIVVLIMLLVAVWWGRSTPVPPPTPLPVAVKSAAAPVQAPPVTSPNKTALPVEPPMVTEMPLPVKTDTGTPASGLATSEQPAEQAVDPQIDQLSKLAKLKARREAEKKRKAELDSRRKLEEAGRSKAIDSLRAHEAEVRSRQEDSAKQIKQTIPSEHRSPQQVCADRPNFISRGICESRECDKPERANAAFCVQMRERRAPKEIN